MRFHSESPTTSNDFIRRKFDELDYDANGALNEQELETLVSWTVDLFPALSKDMTVANLLNTVDQNNDGRVDYEEFELYFEKKMDQALTMSTNQKAENAQRGRSSSFLAEPEFHQGTEDYIRRKFDELDQDANGALDMQELETLISWTIDLFPALSKQDPKDQAAELMQELDKNHDNRICFEEFEMHFEKKTNQAHRMSGHKKGCNCSERKEQQLPGRVSSRPTHCRRSARGRDGLERAARARA